MIAQPDDLSGIDIWISMSIIYISIFRYPDDLRNIVQQCANDQMTIYNLTQVACLGEVWSRSVRGASHVLWWWNHQGLYARLQICWCSVILGKSRNCGVKIVYFIFLNIAQNITIMQVCTISPRLSTILIFLPWGLPQLL